MLILQLYNSSEFAAPLSLVIFEWSLNSFFQSIAFFSREDCPPKLNEFQQSKLYNAEIITSGSYRQSYALTPVHTCTAEIWKNDTLFIPWKSLFASFNRDDWYIFRSIFVFFYLLSFHNSDGVTGLFFPLNMYLGTMYIQHQVSATATIFFGWGLCNFPLPVFTFLKVKTKKWLHLYVRCIYCTTSN